MPLFTTNRERRLWSWTLLIVVAVYSTLAFSQPIDVILRNREWATGAFILALLLVVGTAVAYGLRIRPGGAEVAVALGIAAVYLLAFLRMSIAEERGHLIEYGVLAVLIFAALEERRSNGRPVPAPGLLAMLAAAVIGLVDEAIQQPIPERIFDWRDVGFNTLAAFMAIMATLALAWARRRAHPRNP